MIIVVREILSVMKPLMFVVHAQTAMASPSHERIKDHPCIVISPLDDNKGVIMFQPISYDVMIKAVSIILFVQHQLSIID